MTVRFWPRLAVALCRSAALALVVALFAAIRSAAVDYLLNYLSDGDRLRQFIIVTATTLIANALPFRNFSDGITRKEK
ncbi:hypothetical protein KF840_19365 [bacterium]|nr:hypothetical protein [bacterium]